MKLRFLFSSDLDMSDIGVSAGMLMSLAYGAGNNHLGRAVLNPNTDPNDRRCS
jgi:hypothetical protein